MPTGSVTPLLPLTGVTVVAVNLSPSLLLLLHTRDPLASSSVVPGPMFPVFATGAGGGGGGAGAGAGVEAGALVTGAGADVLGCVAGAVAGGVTVRGAGSLRAGARVSGTRVSAPRCEGAARCAELDGAGADATAAGGVSDFV